MKVVQEVTQPDASAWSALVEVNGIAYVASYVGDRLSVRLAPYKHAPRRPRWHEKVVRDWAQNQIAALPLDWLATHRELYAQ